MKKTLILLFLIPILSGCSIFKTSNFTTNKQAVSTPYLIPLLGVNSTLGADPSSTYILLSNYNQNVNKKDEQCDTTAQNQQIKYLNQEKLSAQFTFDKYKIYNQLTEKLADLDINSNKNAREFRTNIRFQLNDAGINFAGHYTIVSVGMTGWGTSYWIVDRANGKAYNFPYLETLGIDFRKDSNLFIINPKDRILENMKKPGYYSCDSYYVNGPYIKEILTTNARPFYFLWENNKLILLGPKNIKLPINRMLETTFY